MIHSWSFGALHISALCGEWLLRWTFLSIAMVGRRVNIMTLTLLLGSYGGFHKWWIPKMDDLGVPPILGSLHISEISHTRKLSIQRIYIYISALDHKLLTLPLLLTTLDIGNPTIQLNVIHQIHQLNGHPFGKILSIFRLTHICSFAGFLVDKIYVNVSNCVKSFSQTNTCLCLSYFPCFACWCKDVGVIDRHMFWYVSCQ